MKTHIFRLHPGQDLRAEIEKFVEEKNIRAGVVLTCVAGLTKATLRMAGAKEVKSWDGMYEVLSLVGTVESGNSHLHISISDTKGRVFGGHLKHGSIVSTTAEVAIGELEDTVFTRVYDEKTGFDELIVKH